MDTLEINNKYYVTFPSKLPTETIETIDGKFKRGFSGICINAKAKQCKIKIAILMKHQQTLINEHNLLQNSIMNFENFLRPLCITKCEHPEPKQSLLYSIFEIYPNSTCTPSGCLTMQQKREVTKQIFDALDYLQMKNILMTDFKEGTDFEIRKIEEDIRVQIQLINSTDVTDVLEKKGETKVEERVQDVIPKVGMALWQIHWPSSVQYIKTILENASLVTIAAKLSSPGEPLTSNGYLLATMLLAMTHVLEVKKPEWIALKKHPFFWSPSRKTEFIQTFDQYNVETVDESRDPFTQWRGLDKMDELVKTNQQHAHNYNDQNYSSLVKLYRNKFQHRSEIEENKCISIFGTKHLNAENYLAFFEDPIRFPIFLTWLWHCAKNTYELNEFYPSRKNPFISEVRRKLNM